MISFWSPGVEKIFNFLQPKWVFTGSSVGYRLYFPEDFHLLGLCAFFYYLPSDPEGGLPNSPFHLFHESNFRNFKTQRNTWLNEKSVISLVTDLTSLSSCPQSSDFLGFNELLSALTTNFQFILPGLFDSKRKALFNLSIIPISDRKIWVTLFGFSAL